MPTICLNMIVKDEALNIARCLRSVRPLIDSYVIVDTGSTDDTKAIILRELKGLPGELHDREWRNYGFNRTEALQLAVGKADYLLVVDGDDEIVGTRPRDLTADTHFIDVEYGGYLYRRPHLFRADARYHYDGMVHEHLESGGWAVEAFLPDLKYVIRGNGLHPKEKFVGDALLLETALQADPHNPRTVFYLAQSWRDAGEFDKALETYEKRSQMGGFEEERWYSLFQVAVLKRALWRPVGEILEAFFRAYEARPSRIEPMYELGRYLQTFGRHKLCYHLLRPLLGARAPDADRLFLDVGAYSWGLKDVIAGSAYYIGERDLSRRLNEELLADGYLPPDQIVRVTEILSKAFA